MLPPKDKISPLPLLEMTSLLYVQAKHHRSHEALSYSVRVALQPHQCLVFMTEVSVLFLKSRNSSLPSFAITRTHASTRNQQLFWQPSNWRPLMGHFSDWDETFGFCLSQLHDRNTLNRLSKINPPPFWVTTWHPCPWAYCFEIMVPILVGFVRMSILPPCRTRWTEHPISRKYSGCSQSGSSPRGSPPHTSLQWSQTGKQKGMQIVGYDPCCLGWRHVMWVLWTIASNNP